MKRVKEKEMVELGFILKNKYSNQEIKNACELFCQENNYTYIFNGASYNFNEAKKVSKINNSSFKFEFGRFNKITFYKNK